MEEKIIYNILNEPWLIIHKEAVTVEQLINIGKQLGAIE